jgi:hypothetical protein
MSWSVQAFGKPEAVKKALKGQFESAKSSTQSIPHEHATVALTEETVEANLNFLIEKSPNTPVRVHASGSASVAPADSSWPSSTQAKFDIESISGFLE